MARVNIQHNNETQDSVPASVSAVVLAQANPNRRFITIFNNSATATLYVDIDHDPTTSDAMFSLKPMETYFSSELNSDGEYKGIWSEAVGNANIREFTE